MSGIAGIIHFDGAPVEPGLVEKMTAAMAYRGPDGIHHWVNGSVALGQCMLRTTPESLEENQPLTSEDESLVLVMDGRVDNWEELRRELLARGAILRNRSDAELVLRAYQAWDRDCVQHIDGDFALVIWDARRRKAFCARDRMGNKPFFYSWNDDTFVFASELQAILGLPWAREEPNEDMLAEFLAFEWYSRDETLWNGILRLVAAHRMDVGDRQARPKQYWEPDFQTLPYAKDRDYVEHYRELFTDAVRCMSRSHRSVAIQVSGGLDSSAVFSMAEHLRKGARLLAPGMQGFTFAFTDDSEASEITFARAVAEHFGIRIQEIEPSKPPLSWYEERARHYREFPGYPNGVMCLGLMQAASAQGARVVLSGQGGDQWLQGSRIYYAEELARFRWRSLLGCLDADIHAYGVGHALNWFVRKGLFPLLPVDAQAAVRRVVRNRKNESAREPYWLSPAMQERIKQRREQFGFSAERQLRAFGQQGLLNILYDPFIVQVMERFERESARAGVELRHPFYDRRIVQHAFSTPERMRLRGDQAKYMHVLAMQGILPPVILERKTRAYFSVVFHHHLQRMQDTLSEAVPGQQPGWYSPAGMTQLYRLYRQDPQEGRRMWPLWGAFGCNKVMER